MASLFSIDICQIKITILLRKICESFLCDFFIISAVVHDVPACIPSPCGPNSQCREVNSQAVCSCLPTYLGNPPACRPECTVSAECPHNEACMNQKCVDPCVGTCGINAVCIVINHSPICSCKPGHSGDPFLRCNPIPRKLIFSLFFVHSLCII